MDCNYKTLSKELSKIDREIRRGPKACSYHPFATDNIILLRHRSGGNGQICMAEDGVGKNLSLVSCNTIQLLLLSLPAECVSAANFPRGSLSNCVLSDFLIVHDFEISNIRNILQRKPLESGTCSRKLSGNKVSSEFSAIDVLMHKYYLGNLLHNR